MPEQSARSQSPLRTWYEFAEWLEDAGIGRLPGLECATDGAQRTWNTIPLGACPRVYGQHVEHDSDPQQELDRTRHVAAGAVIADPGRRPKTRRSADRSERAAQPGDAR